MPLTRLAANYFVEKSYVRSERPRTHSHQDAREPLVWETSAVTTTARRRRGTTATAWWGRINSNSTCYISKASSFISDPDDSRVADASRFLFLHSKVFLIVVNSYATARSLTFSSTTPFCHWVSLGEHACAIPYGEARWIRTVALRRTRV